MELKYKHEILSEFAKLHFAPRDNQLEIINTILTKFLDENYKNVILCAGTGSGKSVMGLVVSRVLDNIASSNNDELKTHSKIIMNTNVLIDQYIRSFNHLPESEFFYRKGASNYNCDYMESVLPKPWLEPVTAELCVHDDNKCKLKHLCKYYSVFEKQRNTKCLVTNYSYYMMTNILSDKDKGGLINIFDEAHTMNDVFASFCSFVLTNKTANKLKELYEKVHNYFPNYFNDNKSKANNLSGVFDAISKSLEVISIQDEFDLSKIPIPERQNVMIKRQKENVKYFRHILETITEPIKLFSNITNKINSEEYKISIFPWGDTKKDRALYQKKHKLTDEQMRKLEKEYSDKYQTIQSSRKKCQSLLNQIDLIKDDDELLFENIVDGENRGISASPVFIKKYWSRLDKAEYNLLMSATITKEYVESTIALNGKTAYIYVPSVFPKENKMIVDYKSFPLNYANMQKPEVINHLLQSCADIVSMNNDVNGIILTTTFD